MGDQKSQLVRVEKAPGPLQGFSLRTPIPRESLCRVCEPLDIKHFFTREIGERIQLGRWDRIQWASFECTFCALVTVALHEAERAPSSGLRSRTRVYVYNRKSWETSVSNVQYYGPISTEYSNKYDLKSTAKVQAKAMTEPYRLMVKFEGCSDEQYIGQIQYLADHESKSEQQFFGRHVDQQCANIPLINTWLRTCAEVHGASCADLGKASGRLGRIRVIDVENMVVIVAPPDCHYVALSYVWGGPQRYEARKEDFKTSKSGSEYLPLPKDLPQTIIDACTVTRCIGERYLWVDSLCIMQNSDTDRHDQILSMDAIYNFAILTIVAGSRAHSNTGLPGISTPRENQQYRGKVDGLRLAIPFPPLTTLERGDNLIWNSRGWTFQEKVMSRRLLLFTDYQVYFRCSNMVWCEDVMIETTHASKSMYKKLQPFRWAADRTQLATPTFTQKLADFITDKNRNMESAATKLLNYTSVIEEFTRRTLTKPDDAVNAVIGVLQTLKNTGPFYHGMPHQFLDASLLWHVPDGHEIARKPLKVAPFPSWTWAAWETPNGCSWLLRDLRSTANNKKICPKWILSETGFENTWWDGNTDVGKPSLPLLSNESLAILRKIEYLLYMRASIRSFSVGRKIKMDLESNSRHSLEGKIAADYTYHFYQILNDSMQCVGEIWMSNIMRMRYENCKGDFVCLSAGRSLVGAKLAPGFIPTIQVAESDGNGGTTYKTQNQPKSEWIIVNVMLVEWTAGGQIAKRLAIGKVIASAFKMDRREWILLG